MRASDIVAQLQRRLPLFTQEFTDTHAVTSATHSGTLAYLTTATSHGIAPGDQIHIRGAQTPIAIASLTHTPGSTVATIVTTTDHDLTLYSTWTEGNVALVEGANEAQFNGALTLLDVPNRRTLTVAVPSAAPSAATGAPRLMNGSNAFRTLGGLYGVNAVPSSNALVLTHDRATDLGTLAGSISIRTSPRITGVVNVRAADLAYSKEFSRRPKPWAYVVLRDATTSRSRQTTLDAVDINALSGGWQQTLVQPFSILVAIPMADEHLGRGARDRAEDLVRAFCLSLLGVSFPTGFARSKPSAPVQFVGHAGQETEPGPYYVHGYDFEQTASIGIDDTASVGEHVAFRDIALDMGFNVGTGRATADVDLDDVPL